MHAIRIPSTSLSQSQAMQLQIERAVSRFPEVGVVFSQLEFGHQAARQSA